ncbi:9138_t:CDS:2 [Funneliformis mosseae]|uniref:UV excision repair protein RAD23 n=1 Tax=Funneliformis mosseae TaxID=27381 RepID=A0A9N9GD84_FUNMO|nr:9138_t:CDS:2 [Funneliformis mosseae]
MKITIKTLQQKQFQLDIDTSESILQVKQRIEETQGHAVSFQKLISKGKILNDDKQVSEYSISENDFLVLMVSKPKQSTAPSNSAAASEVASKTNTEATATSSSVPAAIPAPVASAPLITSSTSTTTQDTITTTNVPPTTQPIQPSSTSLWDNASALVTGTDYENAVNNIMEMGFDRDQVAKAMRASFNNPDRAVEYLMTSIPDEPTVTEPAATQPTQQVPNPGVTPTTTAGLRSQPLFQQLRQIVQQNPSMLQPLLQQLGQSNPQFLQLINSNPEYFMRLLQEGEEAGEGNLPPPQYVSVTQEEKEAIDRLEALGFERALAIEAFLACDRNEEMAANYLFDHMNEED